jgi:hypothetical protein
VQSADQRQFAFWRAVYEVGALAQCERPVSLDFAPMRRDHERLDASQFPGGHDGKGMVATRFEAPEFDFHAGLPRQLLQPDAAPQRHGNRLQTMRFEASGGTGRR